MDDLYIDYYDNGNISCLYDVKNNYCEGIYQCFFSNGIRDIIDQNKDRSLHGPKIRFNYKQMQKVPLFKCQSYE